MDGRRIDRCRPRTLVADEVLPPTLEGEDAGEGAPGVGDHVGRPGHGRVGEGQVDVGHVDAAGVDRPQPVGHLLRQVGADGLHLDDRMAQVGVGVDRSARGPSGRGRGRAWRSPPFEPVLLVEPGDDVVVPRRQVHHGRGDRGAGDEPADHRFPEGGVGGVDAGEADRREEAEQDGADRPVALGAGVGGDGVAREGEDPVLAHPPLHQPVPAGQEVVAPPARVHHRSSALDDHRVGSVVDDGVVAHHLAGVQGDQERGLGAVVDHRRQAVGLVVLVVLVGRSVGAPREPADRRGVVGGRGPSPGDRDVVDGAAVLHHLRPVLPEVRPGIDVAHQDRAVRPRGPATRGGSRPATPRPGRAGTAAPSRASSSS